MAGKRTAERAHYDFNWQIVYEYAKPVKLPAGTTVRVEAKWDNSANNKYNPHPDQVVYWGEQSWDEMFSPILRAVVPLKEPIMPTRLCQWQSECAGTSGSGAALAFLYLVGARQRMRPRVSPGDLFRMNRFTNIVCLLVAAGSANAQGQPSKPSSDRPPLVEVVGCLSQTGANWVLTNASDLPPLRPRSRRPKR